jgi:hypothetical protein
VNKGSPIIIGAGLAGLLAAHAWPRSQVVEASPSPRAAHAALLRFRGEDVSKLTGIEFRKVRVRKGIWSEGGYRAPSIRLANLYAQKVLGAIGGDRSIWNIEPVDRYIAPESFYDQLVDNVGARIQWASPVGFTGWEVPLISTAPLPHVLTATGLNPGSEVSFNSAPITVLRGRVPGADVFQTVYFPDSETGLYRASITGDLVIAEFVEGERSLGIEAMGRAFALRHEVEWGDLVNQRYGKIAPIPDLLRKQLLYRLTVENHVYSVGRFATWRNILLDDVVNDLAMVRRLMRSSDYDKHFSAS